MPDVRLSLRLFPDNQINPDSYIIDYSVNFESRANFFKVSDDYVSITVNVVLPCTY